MSPVTQTLPTISSAYILADSTLPCYARLLRAQETVEMRAVWIVVPVEIVLVEAKVPP